MSQIFDVSPKESADTSYVGHSVMGRMLSLACTQDGKELYAGSYSNLWYSTDGGQHWDQLTWPQPDPSQFDVPGALGGWCVVDVAARLGWRVDKHPRVLANLTKSGFVDIVGFGECGVWTALGNGDGTFQPPNVVLPNFGLEAGAWHVDKHPRFVLDLNKDGVADIIGFGDDGVWTAIGNGDGTFQDPIFVLENFGYNQGWRVNMHPRFVVDIDNDGIPDIVGCGDAGVWTAKGDGSGGFQAPVFTPGIFGFYQGWRVNLHPRFVVDVNHDGFADIVGFTKAGVVTALGNGDGTFQPPQPACNNFGLEQGWRVNKHPRFVVDLNNDGYPDILGFGDAYVWTALNKADGSGTFNDAQLACDNFCYDQGWRVEHHPRFVADLNGDHFPDILGFGDDGVWTATAKGDGTFNEPNYVLANFGVQQGWRVDKHPRLVGDLAASGFAGIVAFGDAGVWSSTGDRLGGFPTSNYVLSNFGYGTIVLAMTVVDQLPGSRGLWRSTDGGSTWMQISLQSLGSLGQLQWALGSDHLVYAAIGSALAISKDAGATFQEVFPWGSGQAQSVNHVAVWQNSPADLAPAVIYALGDNSMFLSFDGGASWMQDHAALPPNVGSVAGVMGNFNTPTMMVISPRFPLEVFVAGNGGQSPQLHRGDYSQFPFGNQTSSWDDVPVPAWTCPEGAPHQDSGNMFLATTQKGCGDLLFYGPELLFQCNTCCSSAFVGPLYPESSSDWISLGPVHADLHGILLSPGFHASITNGNYHPGAGTVWIMSDGGIYRSTNGGQTFNAAENVTTLASLSVAGVATTTSGPALSLNQGDNDGFYSKDGGQNWSYQQYGGGDNDCAFADPLRSHAMMIFTPRWDTAGDGVEHTWQGQTVAVYQTDPGKLPDASATGHDRKAVTGPPTDPDRDIWNASSPYGLRGFKPIVLGLAGEDAPTQGDYIFVLNPNSSQPMLVRTQNIFDVKHREEWLTTATGPGHGANVYLQGPPLPSSGLGVVQASGGHASTVFYAGGNGELWKLTDAAGSWIKIAPALSFPHGSVGVKSAIRFFVSPYDPKLIYLLDEHAVKRSDDGGVTWRFDPALQQQLTLNANIPVSTNDPGQLGDFSDVVLADMQFDPNLPLLRFAIGYGGAFVTIDGATWTRLLHTGAFSGRPTSCYYDGISPSSPSLYVALGGRSLIKISDFQITQIF